MKINFSGMKTMSFDPVPAGLYEVAVSKVKTGTSTSGYAKIDITFDIVDDGQYNKRKLFTTLTTHPNALWKFYEGLNAFGYTEEDLEGDEEGNVEFDPQDLLEAGCYADVIITEYQGKEKNSVEKLRSHEEIEGLNAEDVEIEEDEDFYDDPEEAFEEDIPETVNLNVDASSILSPAAKRVLQEYLEEMDRSETPEEIAEGIEGTGKNGLITKKDMQYYLESWEGHSIE